MNVTHSLVKSSGQQQCESINLGRSSSGGRALVLGKTLATALVYEHVWWWSDRPSEQNLVTDVAYHNQYVTVEWINNGL